MRGSATLSGAITVAASPVLAEDPAAMHEQVRTQNWHTHGCIRHPGHSQHEASRPWSSRNACTCRQPVLSRHTEPDIVAVARASTAATRGQVPDSRTATDTQGSIVPASTPHKMIGVRAIERLWIAGIGLTPIGNPLPGITDHIHASIGAGSVWIAADRRTLIHFVSAGGRVVILGVVALLGIPRIAPRPGIRVLLLVIPSGSFLPFRFRRQSSARPFAVGFCFIVALRLPQDGCPFG